MKISKSKFSLLVLVIISLVFIQCKNTTKGVKEDLSNIKTQTESETSKINTKINTIITNDKMYFDYKIEHEKALLEIEKAKEHFIIENDKFKANAALDKVEKHLSNLEKSLDNDYHNFVAKTKLDIKDTKQSIKNNDKTVKDKLESLSNSFSNEISKLNDKIDNEKNNISIDSKRHYAELRAKKYLLKAKLATNKKETYAKAAEYLDNADKEYIKAEQYGNEKYKATIEDLRKDIKSAKNNIKSNSKKVKKSVNALIIKLGGFSQQINNDYPYILIP